MPKSPCTKCLDILGVDSRMRIYEFLKGKGKKTVTEIVKIAELTQPTVSYHLKAMKDAGLLLSERKGKEIYYYVNEDCVLKDVKFKKGK